MKTDPTFYQDLSTFHLVYYNSNKFCILLLEF